MNYCGDSLYILNIGVTSGLSAETGNAIVGRTSLEHAPVLVVQADPVQAGFPMLRSSAEHDDCSYVTTQEYVDRFETVYHFKS